MSIFAAATAISIASLPVWTDELFESRWSVSETMRDEAAQGWWTICLYRDAGRSESEERLLR